MLGCDRNWTGRQRNSNRNKSAYPFIRLKFSYSSSETLDSEDSEFKIQCYLNHLFHLDYYKNGKNKQFVRRIARVTSTFEKKFLYIFP